MRVEHVKCSRGRYSERDHSMIQSSAFPLCRSSGSCNWTTTVSDQDGYRNSLKKSQQIKSKDVKLMMEVRSQVTEGHGQNQSEVIVRTWRKLTERSGTIRKDVGMYF